MLLCIRGGEKRKEIFQSAIFELCHGGNSSTVSSHIKKLLSEASYYFKDFCNQTIANNTNKSSSDTSSDIESNILNPKLTRYSDFTFISAYYH